MAQPPLVTIVVPAYLTRSTAAFLPAALAALQAQTLPDWEAVVVDDGSPVPVRVPEDARFRLVTHERNRGLGAALNTGLDCARAALVGYLPVDDLVTPEHLATLVAALDGTPEAVAAVAGVRHHYNRYAEDRVPGEPWQLVQVLHRAGDERWLDRSELVTDDLDRMFWHRLRARGTVVGTGAVTCEWVDHPHQLTKLLREPTGGLNTYRAAFGVREPIRIATSVGNPIDEVEQYRRFRDRPAPPKAADGLRILLVGELAYNPERVLALTERGHRLYGLWMPDPYWYNTVGPLPFGHVTDLPRDGWQDAARRERIDVIYALLNWQAVPFAAQVRRDNRGIPFVWHYKEGPFISRERGHWADLVELTTLSDGVIASSPEMQAWTELAMPGAERPLRHVLDGDLPKREWFTDDRAAKLSDRDGEVHTVVPGRPIGLHPETVAELAEHRVHLHFYGDFTHGQWREWIARTERLAPGRLHLHGHVDQRQWVREFSRYDAGWLHTFASRNGGDLRRADWDDLNYPARLATLVAAGLPVLQRDNAGSVVATQTLVRQRGIGLFFRDVPDLAAQLHDRALVAEVAARGWEQRLDFTFDAHADDLAAFLRRVVSGAQATSASDTSAS